MGIIYHISGTLGVKHLFIVLLPLSQKHSAGGKVDVQLGPFPFVSTKKEEALDQRNLALTLAAYLLTAGLKPRRYIEIILNIANVRSAKCMVCYNLEVFKLFC